MKGIRTVEILRVHDLIRACSRAARVTILITGPRTTKGDINDDVLVLELALDVAGGGCP